MKLLCNYLIREKKKSVTIVLTVILMTATMTCLGSLFYCIQNCEAEYTKTTKGYYEYILDVTQKQIKEITRSKHNNCQIGTVQYIENTENPVPVQLLACDENFLEMNHMKLVKGKMPSSPHEIVVENWVLNNLGDNIGIGDKITFGDSPYIISGILKDSFFKSAKEMNVFTPILKMKGGENIHFF